MPRFFSGDELGNIKALTYLSAESKVTVETLYDGSGKGKHRAVQKMAVSTDGQLLVVACADGSASVFQLKPDCLEPVREWTERRLSTGQKYIGLAASSAGVYTCTSNGALRLTPFGSHDAESQTAVLPMRLYEWRTAPDGNTFSYGGDEVELSVWDLESAFASKQKQPAPQSEGTKKRKRANDLLPGEIWRAKNVANDALSLRQPVHNTCLSYLSTPQQIVAGTQRGDVRRYDTRAARKPVAEWKQISKGNGIGSIAKGHNEHEVFASDQTSSLFAVDARNGRVIYGYKGIAGAVTSIAPSPTGLVSTALDRYARVHSTYPPPTEVGQPQDNKGAVLERVYMKSVPTCVIWDEVAGEDADKGDGKLRDDAEVDSDTDDIWEGMPVAEDSEDEGDSQVHRRRKGHK
ncbi:WD40-repeat-containing domain protein [Lactarius tabidus]